jgi:hypothetical protein
MHHKVLAIIAGWLIFIGIDFVFHGAVFAHYWQEEISAFKSLENLALLIPSGYLSFLLLTILEGHIYFRFFPTPPQRKALVRFAMIFAGLFSLSGFFGMYSFLAIPTKHLLIFNSIYFVELLLVPFAIDLVARSGTPPKRFGQILLVFFLLIIVGIILQNLL